MRHLGPGSALPAWVEALDLAVFDTAWGPLEDHEELWLVEGLGYARWSLVAVVGEAELLRIAVTPEARGQGLGRQLLANSSRALQALGITQFRLEVRVSNTPARHLYEAEGWHFQGIRKGYYRDGEDAALYGKESL
ncbi:MAG: GNAT family N-acetyltransferase [Holophaga sp.]|nr:GNAT family N-acetyltransferase [Holophaga sp.]